MSTYQKNYSHPVLRVISLATSMCEFKVVLNERVVWNDVVYAKVENGKVILKNVAGQSKEFKNCKIVEVDVNTTRLVLASP